MVARAWLLGALLLLGCTREYDDVTPALEDDGYVVEDKHIYNRNIFRGNDSEGQPFLALCPLEQALVGMSVGLSDGEVAGVTLQCADFDEAGNLGAPSYGERFGARQDPATEQEINCSEGKVAVALMGSEELFLSGYSVKPPSVPALGIECADAHDWMTGTVLATEHHAAGTSHWGTAPFSDSCAAGIFVLNGFYGRFSSRLEQVSRSCFGPNDDFWKFFGL